MWLFICTEILLFGGLFLLYSVYRYKHPADFHAASLDLSRFDGTLNTVVLITSSLTAALAVHELREGRPARTRLLIGATILLALTFLTVKGFEWAEKFGHGLYPSAPHLLSLPTGQILYFGLYFTMTGLHALHVIVGMGIFGYALRSMSKGRVGPERPILVENATLFWHLVDVIWIFLFPLFYLIS
jgi:cytochrome c oxidase subunit III